MLTERELAYDRYVTVEQPGSYNRGWQMGFAGEEFDDRDEPSEQAYKQGYEQGASERELEND